MVSRGRKRTHTLIVKSVPGVVVGPLLLRLGWEMLGDISYHKATLQSEGKHSFTFIHIQYSMEIMLCWKCLFRTQANMTILFVVCGKTRISIKDYFFRDLLRLLTFKKIGLEVGAFSLICQMFVAVVWFPPSFYEDRFIISVARLVPFIS